MFCFYGLLFVIRLWTMHYVRTFSIFKPNLSSSLRYWRGPFAGGLKSYENL